MVMTNRRAEKTIALVFQIRLQLIRAKSVFQFPDMEVRRAFFLRARILKP